MKSPKELRTLADMGARIMRSPEKITMEKQMVQMQVPIKDLLEEIGGLHMQNKQQIQQTNMANREIQRLNTELKLAQEALAAANAPKPLLVPDSPGVESGDGDSTKEAQA
jgi:hypothetical protein